MLQPGVISLLDQAAFGQKLRLLSVVGFAVIGRGDSGVRWLATAADCGFIDYPYLAKRDPFLEWLRGDAELESLMNRVRQRWEVSMLNHVALSGPR